MTTILTPGYLRWDGSKYVLDPDLELVGRMQITNVTSGPYTVQSNDRVVSVSTLSAILTINLPAVPTIGDAYTIKDANGSAASFNITVQGNGNNIDAASSSVISSNYGILRVVYNGTKWILI